MPVAHPNRYLLCLVVLVCAGLLDWSAREKATCYSSKLIGFDLQLLGWLAGKRSFGCTSGSGSLSSSFRNPLALIWISLSLLLHREFRSESVRKVSTAKLTTLFSQFCCDRRVGEMRIIERLFWGSTLGVGHTGTS
jgi:hypothetical protein